MNTLPFRLAVFVAFAAASASAQTNNAIKVAQLLECNARRQGRMVTVSDASPDCTTGSGVSGTKYALCICNPATGWFTLSAGTTGASSPTAEQKAAMGGTSGAPSASNLFVTDADSRNADARTPTAHQASHLQGGSDALSGTLAVSIAGNAATATSATTAASAISAATALGVSGFAASRCARFNGSGVLVAAAGDCASGDTDTQGSGTVTSVAVATANGISGIVANATSTPYITLSLGAITPTSVAASGAVTASNISGTNTGDQVNISGNAATATMAAGVSGFTASRCARFNSSGVLVASSGDCSAGDTNAGGTVTTASVTSANGVSASVANATTTPAFTFALGAITPSSVAATGAVTGSNLSGTNTGDQSSVTGNAGTATALASNGSNCAAGFLAAGVDASGNAEGCTAAGAFSIMQLTPRATPPFTCDAGHAGAVYFDNSGSGTFCDCAGDGWINRYTLRLGSGCV